ncbi:uncharacterized protein LY89DRAFT_779601 [Mollisia scopiformis]|uniref:2EXR domain-containing protein n=1 Tax=Mollisia scopiformis TaxID=149040 RepID=A0A194XHS0_MOLSC|nr:uncharacterized protein LY89DRAFT_779601 [Mollisia scopiformis]KUJ19681.1 hypothetical protein LY89DRAFT_779601 [Mollisia scopiformis]
MGNLLSISDSGMLTIDALPPKPQNPPPPHPDPVVKLLTPTISGGLESFQAFPKLPIELQAKVWRHALEPCSVTHRVLRIIYNTTTNAYTYAFNIPPLMTICQVSRRVAQLSYPSLIPKLQHPVYFNPAVDFLYCTSTHDWSSIRSQDEVFATLSILNSSVILEHIRFLAVDYSYWSHQSSINSRYVPPDTNAICQLPELGLFASLEELFLVVPSLEEHLICQSKGFTLVTDPYKRAQLLEARSKASTAYDAALPPSIMPGYRVYAGPEVDFLRRWELERCFGLANLPYFGNSGVGWKSDTYKEKDSLGNPRRVLKCTEIRPYSK